MWEIDPETKSKLLVLQKSPPNAQCADCSNPSPQWASPKFGTFICLDCAGVHRGMGVHVSFVRSVMMDSFKAGEVRRMEEGGNAAWRAFWEAHEQGGKDPSAKKGWESVVIERYDGPVGEEYKERLAAKVEGREYVPLPKKEAVKRVVAGGASGAGTPGRTASPASIASGAGGGGKKERNEAYFAKMGAENASRPADLPPSQGGKYAGFGSGFATETEKPGSGGAGAGALPGVDDFQKDPVAALSKGFGWFTSAVGKQAKSVNEGWLQPNMQKLAESEFAATAKQTATTVAANVSKGAQGAASTVGQGFNRFVEGEDRHGAGGQRAEPEKKDFWDSFGAGGSGGNSGSGKTSTGSAAQGTGGGKERKEEWAKDDW